MTHEAFAARIDHTILHPQTTLADVTRIVEEAVAYRFASVCVAPIFVSRVADMLKSSSIPVCSVVAFPHGTSKPTLKAIEASSAVKDGAREIDVVAHLPYLANHQLDLARAELLEIVRAARAARRETVVKVIVESAYLLSLGTDRGQGAMAIACQAVRESGCDFIKTSTGFHPAGGASLEAIQLMKINGQSIQIKASGGIRDLSTALAMLRAGADRLGMSGGVAMVEELRTRSL